EGTLDGALLSRVRDEFGREASIVNIPGDGLAELVERGDADAPAAHALLRGMLAPAVERGADTIVLGCTHYHFLSPAIRAEFPGVTLIDTAEPVARRTLSVLHEHGLEAPPGRSGALSFIVSGDAPAFREVAG